MFFFIKKNPVRASTHYYRFAFGTSPHALFVVKGCQFALLMLNFVIVFWSSEFLLWMFTVITHWSLLKGLSVTFQGRMGCEEGDAIVRSISDFKVPDVLVSLPSF